MRSKILIGLRVYEVRIQDTIETEPRALAGSCEGIGKCRIKAPRLLFLFNRRPLLTVPSRKLVPLVYAAYLVAHFCAIQTS